jgi:hypothetical protein
METIYYNISFITPNWIKGRYELLVEIVSKAPIFLAAIRILHIYTYIRLTLYPRRGSRCMYYVADLLRLLTYIFVPKLSYSQTSPTVSFELSKKASR